MPDNQNIVTAAQVAKVILRFAEEDEMLLTHMHLQKLLFYVQAYCLGRNQRPIFSDTVEAWLHGPVVPDIYHKTKQFGKEAVDYDAYDSEPDVGRMVESFVACVWDELEQYSAIGLRNKSHKEDPWKNAFADKTENGTNGTITNDSMAQYYKPKKLNLNLCSMDHPPIPQEWFEEEFPCEAESA